MIALALAWLATAHAERPLTVQDAVDAASRSNPSVQVFLQQVAAARAATVTATGTAFDPTWDTTGGWNTSRSVNFFSGVPYESNNSGFQLDSSVTGQIVSGTNYRVSAGFSQQAIQSESQFFGSRDQLILQPELRASLTQQILRGSQFTYNLQNVTRPRRALSRQELAAGQTAQQVLADTLDAYWSWAYAASLADIAAARVASAEEALRVGALKVAAGELAPVERTRLEAALVQARVNAVSSRNTARGAGDTLLLAMGEAPGQDVLPATPVREPTMAAIDPAKAVEVALASSFDLRLARADLETADLDLRVARHAVLPTLAATVSGGVSGIRDMKVEDSQYDLNTDFAVNGQFTVPLGNRAARGARDEAAAQSEIRRIQLAEAERRVASQVLAQVRTLQSAAEQISLADTNLRLAEETLAAEEALLDAGRVLMKDVLESRVNVDNARGEAVKARVDYEKAVVALRRLQGTLGAD